MNWQSTKIGEICEFIYGKGLPKRDRSSGSYPVYGSGGIVDFHGDYYVEGPGVIVGRKGTIGSVQFSKNNYWPIDTVFYIKPNPSKYNIKFLYYFLNTISFSELNSDAAVPGLNINVAYSQTILFPELHTQHKIASILSAYDDLIENNNRRIKILEEMAQAIYKEWFVNFRFPGHEDVKFVDSELGKIPEGWEVKTLGEVANIVMGQSPKSEYYNSNGDGLPFHQGVTNFGIRNPVHKTYCVMEKRLAEKGDILFSVRAPVGRMNRADTKLIVGRGLAAIRHKDDLQLFLYYQLKNLFYKEDSIGSGAIFNAVTKDDMHKIKIVIPNENIDEQYDNILKPLDSQMENLILKNQNLRKTRDLLLPKLMSGEIDVDNINI